MIPEDQAHGHDKERDVTNRKNGSDFLLNCVQEILLH
jgi:hypothetical protein